MYASHTSPCFSSFLKVQEYSYLKTNYEIEIVMDKIILNDKTDESHSVQYKISYPEKELKKGLLCGQLLLQLQNNISYSKTNLWLLEIVTGALIKAQKIYGYPIHTSLFLMNAWKNNKKSFLPFINDMVKLVTSSISHSKIELHFHTKDGTKFDIILEENMDQPSSVFPLYRIEYKVLKGNNTKIIQELLSNYK